ncbi:hypothetical protein O181_103080 [Austropuccinia psidii MF-1]|uniref:Uncharacterized protein n=1 Tax=Austropuccinia psidii MF-1 TaxID=1389203 RepID=A0A9Q3JKV5_9BASI|nr:hypothetical protein [Austropuccinia psidii MF-1]
MPKEYDCNTNSQCQPFTPTFPTSNLLPPSYPSLFLLTSKKKLIQLPSGIDLSMMTPPHSMIQTPLLPHQKTKPSFLWDKKSPMDNPPIPFGLPHLLDPLLMPGT